MGKRVQKNEQKMRPKQPYFTVKANIRIITLKFFGRKIFTTRPVVKDSVCHFCWNGVCINHGTVVTVNELKISFEKKRTGSPFATNRADSI